MNLTTPQRKIHTSKRFDTAEVTLDNPAGVKLSHRKLKELLPVETQGFSRPLARLGERNLANYLQEQGYFFAGVHSRCEPAR